MPNDFVNTITTKDGTTYNVQDKRLTVTAADAGKVVSVDSNGNLSLTTPSSGTKLYRHLITINETIKITVISAQQSQYGMGEIIDISQYNNIVTMYYNNKLCTYMKTGRGLEITDCMGNSTTVTAEITSFTDTVTVL